MITKQLHDGWRMRVAGDRQWFPAQVPGSVYQDLLNSGMIDDPYDRDNELAALAVMDQDFEYELEIHQPGCWSRRRSCSASRALTRWLT